MTPITQDTERGMPARTCAWIKQLSGPVTAVSTLVSCHTDTSGGGVAGATTGFDVGPAGDAGDPPQAISAAEARTSSHAVIVRIDIPLLWLIGKPRRQRWRDVTADTCVNTSWWSGALHTSLGPQIFCGDEITLTTPASAADVVVPGTAPPAVPASIRYGVLAGISATPPK